MNTLKKLAILLASIAPVALGTAGTASAATLVSSQVQTVDGQNFNFQWTGVPAPTGAGTLTFLIRGDFSGNFPGNESYDFNLENVLTGTNLGLNTGTLVQDYGFDDRKFTQSFALSLSQLQTLTADGKIDLFVDYAFGVSATLPAAPSITATIDYVSTSAVPEPSTWAMMMAGFGAVGFALRRKQRQTVKRAFA